MKLHNLMKYVLLAGLVLVMAAGCSRFENTVQPEAEGGSMAKVSDTYNAVDDIMLVDDYGRQMVYEDAEDGEISNWWKDPGSTAAEIHNVYDAGRGSKVIELFDMGTNTGFILADGEGEGSFWNYSWNNSTHFNLRFSIKYNVDFVFWVIVSTAKGNRYIEYTPEDVTRGLKLLPEPNTAMSNTVQIGLGSDLKDGQWHTVTRDLRTDLRCDGKGLEEEIVEVRVIKVRGYSTNTPPVPDQVCDSHTPYFWRRNIKRVIFRCKSGHMSREELNNCLCKVRNYPNSPFKYLSFYRAYDILNYRGYDAKQLLKKQLLAAHLNYAAGSCLEGGDSSTQTFLEEGRKKLHDYWASRRETLKMKRQFHAYNNGHCRANHD